MKNKLSLSKNNTISRSFVNYKNKNSYKPVYILLKGILSCRVKKKEKKKKRNIFNSRMLRSQVAQHSTYYAMVVQSWISSASIFAEAGSRTLSSARVPPCVARIAINFSNSRGSDGGLPPLPLGDPWRLIICRLYTSINPRILSHRYVCRREEEGRGRRRFPTQPSRTIVLAADNESHTLCLASL